MSKPNRTPRWLLVAGGLGLILLIALLGQRLTVAYRTPLSGCMLDHGTGGGLGLSRWAKRLGVSVHPVEVPVWEAGSYLERATGNCLLTMGNGSWSPVDEDFDEEKWRTLRRWLAQGNVLVVVTARPESLPELFRKDFIEPLFDGGMDGKKKLAFGESTVAVQPRTETLPARDGGSLTVAADGLRWRVKANAGPTTPVAWTGDDRGSALFRIPVGEGAVYLLLDEFAWTNAGLDQDGNAAVLAGVLEREVRGGVLGIDEYRHGHGRAESFLTYLLSLPGATQALGITVLWSLFYLYGRNVRLRPAEVYPLVERRTAQEYIDAVAQLQERARAAPLVVEAVARRLRYLSLGPTELSPTAAELLSQAERYLDAEDRPAHPTVAMKLAVELIRVRKQLYGSRTLS